MKKKLLYLFALICSMSMFTACSDDDDKPNWKKLPTQEISAGNLALTTNTLPQVGASVKLAMVDENNGVLTLTKAIRGVNEIEIDIVVTEQTGGLFQYQGTASVPTTKVVSELVSSIAVKVNGNITMDGKAKVEVTTETSGDLVKKWLLCDKLYTTTGTDVKRRPYAPAKINLLSTYSGGKTADNISNLGSGILSAVMVKLLKDVEFKADGNIVADYAQEINIETADIVKGILSSLPSTSNVSWVTSPTNFAYWYVSGDHINLVLNLSSIINKIMENQDGADTKNTVALTEILEGLRGMKGAEIKALLSGLLGNLGSEGILSKLDLTKISDADVEKLVGYLLDGFPLNYEISEITVSDGVTIDNIYVYLDKDFFDMLMPLIYPLLPELDALIDGLDIKILGSPVGKYIRTMLNIESMTDLEQVWKESTVFKIGIDISSGSHKVSK